MVCSDIPKYLMDWEFILIQYYQLLAKTEQGMTITFKPFSTITQNKLIQMKLKGEHHCKTKFRNLAKDDGSENDGTFYV
jgi:hypothetical protein